MTVTVAELIKILETLPPEIIVTRADVDYGEVLITQATRLEGEDYLVSIRDDRVCLT